MASSLFPSPNLTAFSSSRPRSRFSAPRSRLYPLGSADAGVSWCPVLASSDAVRARPIHVRRGRDLAGAPFTQPVTQAVSVRHCLAHLLVPGARAARLSCHSPAASHGGAPEQVNLLVSYRPKLLSLLGGLSLRNVRECGASRH